MSFSGLFRGELRADNGRKWNTGGTKHGGFYCVKCIYCNSTLTRKKGRRTVLQLAHRL